jgi:hypothetical protein
MTIKCKFCQKDFASYSSRSNHIKKFHSEHIINKYNHHNQGDNHFNNPNNPKNINELGGYKCSKCNKNFGYYQNRWRHEQKCTVKNSEPTYNNDDIKELIKENQELRKLIEKSLKIKPRELEKINNQLNNNNITFNNTIINNINNYVPLGLENLPLVLSEKEQLMILNRRAHSLCDLIKLVHISDKYKQFKNVYITNLQNSIAYKYDDNSNSFIAVNKSELLDDIVDCRMMDIESFYNNMKDKLDEETVKIMKRFIDRMNNNKDALKGIKKEEIKLLLYNNRDVTIPKKHLEI